MMTDRLVKPIRLTKHAQEQCIERGALQSEVVATIHGGQAEPAKRGRMLYRSNFAYDRDWLGQHYAVKQVAAIVAE